MSARKKIMISMIVILLLLTVGAYGYGVYYFTDQESGAFYLVPGI